MIRVMLADDHNIVREGLRRIIEESEGIRVVAEAADGHEALGLIASSAPRMWPSLISPCLDWMDSRSSAAFEPSTPACRYLVLTMHEEEQYVVRAITAGAMGYVTKRSASGMDLAYGLNEFFRGRYLTEAAAESLAVRLARGREGMGPLDSLSNREIQVLRRLARGQTNREIAEAYFLSTKTVDTYRSRLLRKLRLRNNADLSRFAIQTGLIEP